jgi:hypothetical protein
VLPDTGPKTAHRIKALARAQPAENNRPKRFCYHRR